MEDKMRSLSKQVAVGWILLSGATFAGCQAEEPAGTGTTGESIRYAPARPTPVYVTLYSHNEDNWAVDTLSRYSTYRANLKERLDIIASFGAKLNWQSDLAVLQAMERYETEATLLAETGGVNIIQYIEQLGFAIDPHFHTNNYADLAYLIQALGGRTPTVIGGALYAECGAGGDLLSYMDWHADVSLTGGSVTGQLYPSYTWTPTILSVPAMGGHWFDEFSSGVWRPGNNADFNTDQGSGIVYVGQGYPHDETNVTSEHAGGAPVLYKDGGYIKELVAKTKSGEAPAGQMYTASISIRDTKSVSHDGTTVIVNDGLKRTLEQLKPLRDAGAIKYVTYQEAAEIWRTAYRSQPSRFGIDSFSAYPEIVSSTSDYCSGGVAP
jgi:hypothetical protein